MAAKRITYAKCKLPGKCWCTGCQSAYDRERWKTRDKKAHKAQRRLHNVAVQAWMDELKAKTPCVDCGLLWPPYVSDWDHLPGTTKLGTVSDFVRTGRRRRAEQEMAKCELVCANCHRVRTHIRRNEV